MVISASPGATRDRRCADRRRRDGRGENPWKKGVEARSLIRAAIMRGYTRAHVHTRARTYDSRMHMCFALRFMSTAIYPFSPHRNAGNARPAQPRV